MRLNRMMARMKRQIAWIILVFCTIQHNVKSSTSPLMKPRDGDPFDTFPKNFWQEFSSPFTDPPSNNKLESVEETTQHETYPFFDEIDNVINVTAHLGTSVYLHCRVHELNGKTVSWVRRHEEELNLITFDKTTYSSDSRYSLEYKEPNDWQLLIQYANERDDGVYECQVSSHPPLVLVVYLDVVVPQILIEDERGLTTPEKFYKEGSTIELKCIIEKIPKRPNYVTWKHGNKMLNYDISRGGISVKTDLLTDRALSRLYIANANYYDSGVYTCSLGDTVITNVTVHVLNGENPAAMQRANSSRWAPLAELFLIVSSLFIFSVCELIIV